MKLILITIYSILTLVYGINNVRSILLSDIKRGGMEYGRVSLECSYWYELYAPRRLIEAWKRGEDKPDVFGELDKAAFPLYWRRYR